MTPLISHKKRQYLILKSSNVSINFKKTLPKTQKSHQLNKSNKSTNGYTRFLPYGRLHELQSTSPSTCSHWMIRRVRKVAQSRDKERDPNSP